MSKADEGAPDPGQLWNSVEKAAKRYSNIKALAVAAASVIGTVFAAGVYYNQLTAKLNEYIKRIETLEMQQTNLLSEVISLKSGLADASRKAAADVQKVRSDINSAFIQLTKIDNIRGPFTNTEPVNNGGGHAATIPPGRCNVGEVVVGIQPYKEGSGTRSIVMQCGLIPTVKID